MDEKTIHMAKYYVENKCSIREVAKKFGISKSAVHERLKNIANIPEGIELLNDPSLVFQVKEQLKENKEQSLSRCEEAIAKKYLNKTKTEEQSMHEILIEEENEPIPSAEEFYEATLQNQKRAIKGAIHEAMSSTSPIIRLPFDTYPEIDDEMEELGWEYDYYENEEGIQCAEFTPEQYTYPSGKG